MSELVELIFEIIFMVVPAHFKLLLAVAVLFVALYFAFVHESEEVSEQTIEYSLEK